MITMVAINEKSREVLDELMRKAEIWAMEGMRQSGDVRPALFYHSAKGTAVFAPNELGCVESKDAFSQAAHLMCIADAADASVFVSEVWMASARKNRGGLDLSVPPSQDPNRREVVFLAGESRSESVYKTMPIHRAENGKFRGLGDAPEMWGESLGGRFSNFIPAEVPDEMTREAARMALAEMGMVVKVNRDRDQGYERSR